MELTGDEIAAIGQKIYADIREEMEANHWGELVVIDVHSGDYEFGEFVSRHSELKILKRLWERQPNAQTWSELVGYGAPYYQKPGRRGLFPVVPNRNKGKVASD